MDMVGYFWGPVTGFAHHRGITHTFVGAPVIAAITVGLVYVLHRLRSRFRGRNARTPEVATVGAPADGRMPGPTKKSCEVPRWGLLYCYALIAALSHILLDYTNSYGVRPFEPMSYKWYSWDIVSIVEPLMLGALALGLLMPGLFGLISQEIGARSTGPRGRVGAIMALVAVALIWGVRDFEHRRAVGAMQAITYQDQPALRVSAYPYEVNPFLWYGVVETKNFFQTMHVNSLTPEVDPDNSPRIRYKPEETPVTLAAKKSYLGRVYLDWAQYPLTEQESQQPGWLVRFYDLRYLYPERSGRPALSSSVKLDKDLQVTDEFFGRFQQARRLTTH